MSLSHIALPAPELADVLQARRAVSNALEHVAWAESVFAFVERSAGAGSHVISDPQLVAALDEALKLVCDLSAHGRNDAAQARALCVLGDLAETGAFATYVAADATRAFRAFERAARLGLPRAWFRIGRAYEAQREAAPAAAAYGRGAAAGDPQSLYRMGMAYLLAQLGAAQDLGRGLDCIVRAGEKPSRECAQPPYVLALIVVGEFAPKSPLGVSRAALADLALQMLPASEGPPVPDTAARRLLRRSAYFGYAPAQHRLGVAYEYATLGCAYDPVRSVAYYTLAAKQGHADAQMGLSKWYLCGDQNVPKDEEQALHYANLAAQQGNATAEFAMGYYNEVGIAGRPADPGQARQWYNKASTHGNAEAKERLRVMDQQQINRQEHNKNLENTLIRTRTMARMKSVRRRDEEPEEEESESLLPYERDSQTNVQSNQQALQSHQPFQATRSHPNGHSGDQGAAHGQPPYYAQSSSAPPGPGPGLKKPSATPVGQGYRQTQPSPAYTANSQTAPLPQPTAANPSNATQEPLVAPKAVRPTQNTSVLQSLHSNVGSPAHEIPKAHPKKKYMIEDSAVYLSADEMLGGDAFSVSSPLPHNLAELQKLAKPVEIRENPPTANANRSASGPGMSTLRVQTSNTRVQSGPPSSRHPASGHPLSAPASRQKNTTFSRTPVGAGRHTPTRQAPVSASSYIPPIPHNPYKAQAEQPENRQQLNRPPSSQPAPAPNRHTPTNGKNAPVVISGQQLAPTASGVPDALGIYHVASPPPGSRPGSSLPLPAKAPSASEGPKVLKRPETFADLGIETTYSSSKEGCLVM